MTDEEKHERLEKYSEAYKQNKKLKGQKNIQT